jgi:Zn-finger nucleic acid-binding protein
MEAWRDKVRFMEPTEGDPAIKNPATGMAMEKIEIGGVRIDRCPYTGAIWLDRGELAHINSFTKEQKAVLKEMDTTAPSMARQFEKPKRGMLTGPTSTQPFMVVRDEEQPHIEFEVCPETGGCFFHHGELWDLADYSIVEKVKTLLRK